MKNIGALTKDELDYWLAKLLKVSIGRPHCWSTSWCTRKHMKCFPWGAPEWSPSTDWNKGGPLLPKFGIEIRKHPKGWRAQHPSGIAMIHADYLTAGVMAVLAGERLELKVPDMPKKIFRGGIKLS